MLSRYKRWFPLLMALIVLSSAGHGQGTAGSIAGTITDQNGAVVPNATVEVKGAAGQSFTVTTSTAGTFRIPTVAAGTYSVTITGVGFKKLFVPNVKVDVGFPTTVDGALEVGSVDQVVQVTGGGEVLQTQTATIGATITGRQIRETPIQSRDALDLVVGLPGTNTVGTVRTSTINGLPKGAISTSIDGVEANTSLLKSSDGFFTYIRPRIDAIEEVTVSTANPGAEATGDGAVQIKFVTRRGTNDYTGNLYWQHRNDALNANNWLNNATGLARQKIRLNQYGGNFGGPIPFLNFGDGGGSWFDSGKNKRFFFVNYEEYRLPEQSPTRARNILQEDIIAGNFQWLTGGVTNTKNLFDLAATLGYPSTPDPTILSLLNRIRQSTQGTGAISALSGDVNRDRYNFTNSADQVRKFLTTRLDFNITSKHSLETVFNYNRFRGTFDLLNSVDPAFPGFANGGAQNSDRYMFTAALRSTLGQNVVNEFRVGRLWGPGGFTLVGGTEFFDELYGGQRDLDINPTGLANALSNATARNTGQLREETAIEFTDNLTWVKGRHTLAFGGQFKSIDLIDNNQPRFVPSVGFAVASTDPILSDFFTAANFPGASTTQLTDAAQLYAVLTGRVSSYTDTAYLGADGSYVAHGPQLRSARHRTYGFYAQDTWRIRPNLTVNFGVRWQPQEGFTILSDNYARLSNFDMVYDVSGPGNLFSPGTLTGTVPTAVAVAAGEKAYPTDFNNFAPSLGFVWSPEWDRGLGRVIFGPSGKSVIRGGFSRSFVRESLSLPTSVLGNNPGGSLPASRSTTLGNLTVGTLLRDPNNPNLTPAPFSASASYPITLGASNFAFAFDPDLKTGYVDSFSFGYQRELDENTVLEFRYVGNRGRDMHRLYNINEINTIENGFAQEFSLAQANLYANIAAGRGANFRYFGAGTGTSPLPIFQSYFRGVGDPNNSALYTSAQYANAGVVGALSVNNPNVVGLAANLVTDAGRRANGIAAGRPLNFVNNCPTTLGFCYVMDNSERSWYDSGVVELRRRMSAGLRFQASYVFAKARTNAFAGATSAGGFAAFTGAGADSSNNSSVTLRNPDLDKSYAQIDMRHAFKFDATYDLPFGRGRSWFTNTNWLVNGLVGGWSILPSLRWQSGAPILLENVQLVGMTVRELQESVKVRKVPAGALWLPDDIIANTIAAHNISVTSATGYSTQFGVPTGRFIAPAGYGNCQARFAGDCGFRKLVIYGPHFFKLDASLGKKIELGERRSVELRATFFDVLNRTNWRVNDYLANFTNLTGANLTAGTFGQLLTRTSYQDPFGSNDPGGRIIDLALRINF